MGGVDILDYLRQEEYDSLRLGQLALDGFQEVDDAHFMQKARGLFLGQVHLTDFYYLIVTL